MPLVPSHLITVLTCYYSGVNVDFGSEAHELTRAGHGHVSLVHFLLLSVANVLVGRFSTSRAFWHFFLFNFHKADGNLHGRNRRF